MKLFPINARDLHEFLEVKSPVTSWAIRLNRSLDLEFRTSRVRQRSGQTAVEY